MKVLCIDAKGVNFPKILTEGAVYTASQCKCYEECYDIAEIQFNPHTGRRISFHKRRFISLSEIDEVELAKERELVNA